MTFLPIIDRELRVAARKPSTFWLRLLSALVAIAIGALLMILGQIGPSGPSMMGHALFSTLTWLALVVALSMGPFFTADCLCEEKREGTLGLLFLTSLKGYDVAGGKLLATSLRAVFGLIAVIPILFVASIMGGVSGLQCWRTALALLNALFFSLAAGLMVSAVSRDAQKALAGTVLVLLLLALGGLAIDASIDRRGRPLEFFSLASPLYVFEQAQAWGRNPFWRTLAISHAVGWGMLALACLAVPRCWRERGRTRRFSARYHRWKYGSARWRQRSRRKLLDRNPILWLCCRERWQASSLWVVALVVAGLVVGLAVGVDDRSRMAAISVFGWPFRALLYLWMASQAGRFFFQARRSGLIELVLSAPVSGKQVVLGQWRALLRMFGPPLAVLLAVELAGGFFGYRAMWGRSGGAGGWRVVGAVASGLASVVSTAASLAALAWFGMWMGMTSRTASGVTFKTILFVKIIPGFAVYFVTMVATALLMAPLTMSMAASSGGPVATTVTNSAGNVTTSYSYAGSSANLIMVWVSLLWTCIPAVLTILASIGLIALARSRLFSTFRQLAVGTLGPVRVEPPYPRPPPFRAPPVIGTPAQ